MNTSHISKSLLAGALALAVFAPPVFAGGKSIGQGVANRFGHASGRAKAAGIGD